jgi:hypothetical protein
LWSGGEELAAVVVVEAEAVGAVGVAGDGEEAFVDHAVVGGAEGEQVGGVGGAAVGPVDEVVDVEPAVVAAAGDAAGVVALFDDDAEPGGDVALAAARLVAIRSGMSRSSGLIIGRARASRRARTSAGGSTDVDTRAFRSG